DRRPGRNQRDMARSDRWAIETLRSGAPVWLCHRGFSMFPALCAGDRLRVEPLRPVKPGAIALFERRGSLLAHRVRSPPPLITQGAALGAADAPHDEHALLGLVADVERIGPARFCREVARYLVSSAQRLRGDP